MGFYNQYNAVSVSNGSSNIKGYRELLTNGKVTITDNDGKDKYKTIIIVKDRKINEQRCLKNGRSHYWVKYGCLEKAKGEYLLRFKQGTNKGMDGLSTRYDQVCLGYKGVCKTLYRNGRLIRQRFYHQNGKLCFHFRIGKKELVMRSPEGKVFYHFKGEINSSRKTSGCLVYLEYNGATNPDWSKNGNCEFVHYGKKGNIINKGQFQNRQRTGEWIIRGRTFYFLNGLAIPKRLYNTPPEKLDPKSIFSISDADVRSIFINRIGMDRIAKLMPHRIIHREGDMALMRFKTTHPFQLLKVVCPTTKQNYFLRVPPEMRKCEDARQWTFGASGENPIKFDLEV